MTEQVVKSIIVKKSVADVYRLWANFENFPYFMKHIKSVTKDGPNISHWQVAGPLGMNVEWDAEMTRREENKRIAWSSKDREGTITTSGQVTFNPLPQGETEVTVTTQYALPAGKAGEIVAHIFSNPEKRIEEDLRNFKTYAESF